MKRGTALLAGMALIATGCTSTPAHQPTPGTSEPAPTGLRLVAFDSCADALAGLRSAARLSVDEWGLGGVRPQAVFDATTGSRAAKASDAAPTHSVTNSHEASADEPDLVKTDGRRIVTVTNGVLRVVDPVTRQLTGSVPLGQDDVARWSASSLLLHGDRALVLIPDMSGVVKPAIRTIKPAPGAPVAPSADPAPTDPIRGPKLLLVGLAGAPTVLGEYRIDGTLVDARQTGSTVRVVLHSQPRLAFPYHRKQTEKERLATNQAIVDRAGIDAWLPRYEWRAGTERHTGQVGCDRLSRPAEYSGTSLLTVLSFDLAAGQLADGDPVSIAADGQTVYGTGDRLYVANDRRHWQEPWPARWPAPTGKTPKPATEIYEFDTSHPGRPRYLAAGSVPGWLINQYALSRWQNQLRVATTTGVQWRDDSKSSSGVYVLRTNGQTMERVGQVTGLGKGERIYSVRYLGETAYLVTFRQTDPLYTLDLRDPTQPKVTGELKVNGYSAYLHPAGAGRLLGVGQDATDRGATTGLQVSLFDVSDPSKPTRIAQHRVPKSYSAAEHDPHAFLYWPATGLVALPANLSGSKPPGILVLKVTDQQLTEVGWIKHEKPAKPKEVRSPRIERTLMVDGVLWTVSDLGLKATDPTSLATLGWIAST